MIVSDEQLEAWAIEFVNKETPAGTPFYYKMSFEEYVNLKQQAIERGVSKCIK